MNKQKGRIFLAAAAFWLLPLSVQAAGMEALADVEKISTAQQVLSSFHLPGINRQSHKDKETRRREKADKKIFELEKKYLCDMIIEMLKDAKEKDIKKSRRRLTATIYS